MLSPLACIVVSEMNLKCVPVNCSAGIALTGVTATGPVTCDSYAVRATMWTRVAPATLPRTGRKVPAEANFMDGGMPMLGL
jgi:hypothetical protein